MGRPRIAKHPMPTQPEPEVESHKEPAKSVSKADAVRAALADGLDSPGDIVDFVKRRYGIDLSRQMASSYKAQLRARERKAEGPAAPAKPSADSDLISDMEAVKHLVDKLGADAVRRIVGLFE